ncbi:hypothetical protein DUI87_24535 [Hirundo rustica rustica]|uniref:Uncharacterized protein n=1 Tax=Hirundo rustica rustica TaxID=333673 RepID=A0A3M0JF96_HIRRU|nr:hypothetical protein DUI87_24535 [Hirundo rustica rustica]
MCLALARRGRWSGNSSACSALGTVSGVTGRSGNFQCLLEVPAQDKQTPPTFQQINTHSQLSVACKITNEKLNTLIGVINKNIDQSWPQHRPLRDTTGDWLPAGCSTIPHHSLGLAMQPVPNSVKSAPVQATGCQLIQECAGGDSVKGLAEVQIDNIHGPSCIHQAGHLVIKGDQELCKGSFGSPDSSETLQKD